MTETEWLACDNPETMLDRLPCAPSDRKCRLLVCAFLRRLIPSADHPVWASVALGERWADGDATDKDVKAFQIATMSAWVPLSQEAQRLPRLCAASAGG